MIACFQTCTKYDGKAVRVGGIFSKSMGKESVRNENTISGHRLSQGQISIPKDIQHLIKSKEKGYDLYSEEFRNSEGTCRFKLGEICGV